MADYGLNTRLRGNRVRSGTLKWVDDNVKFSYVFLMLLLQYKCDKCDKGFQVKTWYEEHQNIHNGVKPFACNICGLAFHMNR